MSKSINSSQEKKPDYNNNDYAVEEIQEIKPVIQHNIERKRPVFTLPVSKKRCTSQGKPFNLIHKYYDENFILEDDEEEEFKKYIKYNGDSRSNSKENSLNSKSSLCNSNKKSLKKIDDIEDNINSNDENINNNNNSNNNSNNKKREKERSSFREISKEFYNNLEDDESL